MVTTIDGFAGDENELAKAISLILSAESAKSGYSYAPDRILLQLTDDGQIIGGLTGATNWDWLYIETLAVDPAYQGQGLGRKLVENAEQIAVTRGCVGAWVDTFTFQSPEFYQRLGYEAFGELPDYPQGEKRVFMRKMLQQ